MEADPLELADTGEDAGTPETAGADKARARLNTRVAITVALLATFMGICKVKDDNIVQAMQQAQAKAVDDWSWYQARNIRAEVAQATADQIRLQSLSQPAAVRPAYEKQAAAYTKLAAEQSKKKEDIKAAAEADGKAYDTLNFHDDQFDLSDALLALAISLLAMTALTQKRWLLWVAMVPTAFGVLMGLAGLCGWYIHPDALIKLLS